MSQMNRSITGSVDMLLDTMCNTFGGVCFIALMVAILSAMHPKGIDDSVDGEDEVRMLFDREMAQLSRQRDELKSALEIQRSFLATNEEGKVVSAASLVQDIASNSTAVARLKAQKVEFEDELAKIKTDTVYSKREAARLERLLKELEEELGKSVGKQRSVRTPTEREISGLKCEDFWLRRGRLYLLKNAAQCKCKTEPRSEGGKAHWTYTIIPGSGYRVDESFFRGLDWQGIKEGLGTQGFIRIYSDRESFPQLCELRDALIYYHKQYNWHVHETDALSFVEGYDGRIQ